MIIGRGNIDEIVKEEREEDKEDYFNDWKILKEYDSKINNPQILDIGMYGVYYCD